MLRSCCWSSLLLFICCYVVNVKHYEQCWPLTFPISRGGHRELKRTTTVSRGKLRGGRRKRRRPDGCHERARALAKRIRRAEGRLNVDLLIR